MGLPLVEAGMGEAVLKFRMDVVVKTMYAAAGPYSLLWEELNATGRPFNKSSELRLVKDGIHQLLQASCW